VPVDEELYRACETELARRRDEADLRRLEAEVFDPIYANIAALHSGPEYERRQIALLSEGLRRCPQSAEAWMRKAYCHEVIGEIAEALAAYDRALAVNEKLQAAYYARGRLYLDVLYDNAAAERELRRAAEAGPKSDLVLVAQARLALLRGDHAQALLLCEEADRVGRGSNDALFVRACIKGDERSAQYDAEEALRLYDKFISVNPSYGPALHNRGLLRWKFGRLDEAIDDFTEAILRYSGDADSFNNRGLVQQDQGRLAGALSDLETAVRLRPNDALFRHNLAQALYRGGQKDRALTEYEEAVRLNPRASRSLNNLGLLRAERGEHALAREAFDRAVAGDPPITDAWMNRGTARTYAQDYRGAIEDYTKALELEPKNATARFNRALVHRHLSDTKAMVADLEAALAGAPADWPDRAAASKLLEDARKKP
jgi:tetratricopeptide (TPR) repeat protein